MKNPASVEKILPQWIERVITEFGGRDPLGLSRVSNIITDYLLTGIITTTDRARYYSFYCWALWHIAIEENCKRYQDFVDAFRKREAVIALATAEYNPQTSPVGVLAVRSRLQTASTEGKIYCDFRVLPSNTLGGYGQYYAGSLYELGLTYRTEDGIDHVTEGDAEELANLFHDVIRATPYIKNKLFRESYMSFTNLKKAQRYLSLDALSESFTKAERQKLIEIFFGFTKLEPSDRDILRRHTLTQILFILSQYQRLGFHANLEQIDWHLVYGPCYYDVLGPINNWLSPYNSPEELTFCKSLWKQFCLQQFFSQAIESLMQSVIETVATESTGLNMETLVTRILQSEYYDIIKNITGKSCSSPYDLLQSFGVSHIPDENISLKVQKELSLENPQSEAKILKISRRTPGAMAARAVLILSVLYAKWRGIKHDVGLNYVESHAGGELWSKPVLFYLDCWLDQGLTWDTVLQTMIDAYILSQHDRIMYEKGRLESCWLHRIEGCVFKDQDYGPRWRSSRHDNAVNILCDLGLVEVDNKGLISISTEGSSILKRILK